MVLLTLMPALVFAQEPTPLAPEPMLHLSGFGTVQAPPDQLVFHKSQRPLALRLQGAVQHSGCCRSQRPLGGRRQT
jgi:hypothetical protein